MTHQALLSPILALSKLWTSVIEHYSYYHSITFHHLPQISTRTPLLFLFPREENFLPTIYMCEWFQITDIQSKLSSIFLVFRLNPVVDKSQPKVIDSSNPVIRSALRSPEKPIVPEGPRAGTAHSALAHPPQLSKLRKGGLQLLPSKNKISKWWELYNAEVCIVLNMTSLIELDSYCQGLECGMRTLYSWQRKRLWHNMMWMFDSIRD